MATHEGIGWRPKSTWERRDVDIDMKEQDGTNLIDKVISNGNL